MNELIFERVVEKLNQLCSSSRGFPSVQRIRKGSSADKLVFETTSGEAKGSLRLDGANLIILMEHQKVTIPLADFLGRSN